MSKVLFCSLGRPLEFGMFEENSEEKPMGWLRVDDLLQDKEKMRKFNTSEVKEILAKLKDAKGGNRE